MNNKEKLGELVKESEEIVLKLNNLMEEGYHYKKASDTLNVLSNKLETLSERTLELSNSSLLVIKKLESIGSAELLNKLHKLDELVENKNVMISNMLTNQDRRIKTLSFLVALILAVLCSFIFYTIR